MLDGCLRLWDFRDPRFGGCGVRTGPDKQHSTQPDTANTAHSKQKTANTAHSQTQQHSTQPVGTSCGVWTVGLRVDDAWPSP
jgi:hypothetical protein